MARDRVLALARVGGCLLLPAALTIVPTAWIEAGPSICLIRRLLGVRCPGCGMTRALSCMAHGHPRQAARHNALVVVVCPLLCDAWLRATMREWRRFVSPSLCGSRYSARTRWG
jgi:hypothetical protein